MFLQPKTYTTPPVNILPDHEPTNTAAIIDGEEVARVLSSKVPCSFIVANAAPQIVSYHFELNNPLDLPKLKRFIPGLAAAFKARTDI